MSIKAIPTKSVTKLKVCLAGPPPYLNEDELPLAELPLISMDCIARAYKLFSQQGHIFVYLDNTNKGFVAGVNPVAYNGKDNIPEATIWGRKPEHYDRLLVATVHRRV